MALQVEGEQVHVQFESKFKAKICNPVLHCDAKIAKKIANTLQQIQEAVPMQDAKQNVEPNEKQQIILDLQAQISAIESTLQQRKQFLSSKRNQEKQT